MNFFDSLTHIKLISESFTASSRVNKGCRFSSDIESWGKLDHNPVHTAEISLPAMLTAGHSLSLILDYWNVFVHQRPLLLGLYTWTSRRYWVGKTSSDPSFQLQNVHSLKRLYHNQIYSTLPGSCERHEAVSQNTAVHVPSGRFMCVWFALLSLPALLTLGTNI